MPGRGQAPSGVRMNAQRPSFNRRDRFVVIARGQDHRLGLGGYLVPPARRNFNHRQMISQPVVTELDAACGLLAGPHIRLDGLAVDTIFADLDLSILFGADDVVAGRQSLALQHKCKRDLSGQIAFLRRGEAPASERGENQRKGG